MDDKQIVEELLKEVITENDNLTETSEIPDYEGIFETRGSIH